MQITKEQIGDLNALVKIQIGQDDYKPKVEKSIKDYSRKIKLKGFRPGKVPSSIVKKMYGNQILFEELNKMLSDELNNYIKENELDILGNPLPKRNESLQIDVLESKDYEFEYELGLAPDFSLSFLEGKPEFTKYKLPVQESEVEEEIEKLQKRFGSTIHPDKMEEEDIVSVKLVESDKDGAPVEEGVENTTSLPIDMIGHDKMKKKFLALKKGEDMQVDIFKFIDKEKSEIARFVLGIEEDKAEDVSEYFNIKIEDINRIEPAEMNKDLFDKVYGNDGVENEEEFKEKIKKELADYYELQAERQLINDIVETLMEKTEIPLPDEFLKKWIKEINEKPISEDEVEKDYPGFAKNLKWSLIVNKIAEKNEIKVEAEEIMQRMRVNLRNQLMQYGYMDFPEEQLNAYIQNMLQDQEQVRKTRDQILEDKIFEHIKTEITMNEKEISVEEFNKLINENK